MLKNKRKGQALVEFALILPVLLLLLLGIIEAARIIWAYMTVQTAVREAARYAVSGRPYALTPDSPLCKTTTGDPNANSPWICDPTYRAEAVESIAISRTMQSINVSTPYRSGGFNLGRGVPNAFGVLVVGQYVPTATIGGNAPVLTQVGHAGNQGLMIKVSAYYNLRMIDPIFDTIMGRNVIEIRGELSMQNEGQDKSQASNPPPVITSTTHVTSTGSGGVGPHGEQLQTASCSVNQSNNLRVTLLNHYEATSPNGYDIYLGINNTPVYKICSAVKVSPSTNSAEVDCPITGNIPANQQYSLYSVLFESTTIVATGNCPITVKLPGAPKIRIDNGVGGNVASKNSWVTLDLIAHQSTDQPFNLYFVYKSGGVTTTVPISNNVPAVLAEPIRWQVPDGSMPSANPCPPGSATPCFIQSFRTTTNTTTVYGSGEFFITYPEIALSGGNMTYAQGEKMYVYLRGHTPGIQYDIKISDSSGANVCWLGRSPAANANGSTTTPVAWAVPVAALANCSPAGGWPDGIYRLTSHPSVGSVPRDPGSMNSNNQIAHLDNVRIYTPSGPYLTVDGGYVWPIGAVINIQAHRHPPANNPYYFRFGPNRVTIAGSTPANTFNTDTAQTYITSYRIPLTTTSGVSRTVAISSFINTGNVFVVDRDVTVFPVPVITVLEGSTVTPDSIITIQITNHTPNLSYLIKFYDKDLGYILTNANGEGQLTYDLKNLPISGPPGDPSTYGTPYDLFSVDPFNNAVVATTQLTLMPADLRVTSVQVPPNPVLNTTMPFTFTIQNASSVTITRYFDTDIYLDPTPIVPSYQPGTSVNFPGDYKYWRNLLPPGASFTLVQPFFIGTYGDHQFYGYTDTSQQIREGDSNEYNNILSNTLNINCTPTFITNPFNATSDLNGWTLQLYGNGDYGVSTLYPPRITGSGSNKQLRLTTDGTSTAYGDDNILVPARGYIFYHLNTPITTTAGLDIRVQITNGPDTYDGAMAGLEVRDTLLPNSPKLEFGLSRLGSDSVYAPIVLFRDSLNPEPVVGSPGSTYNPTTSNPVWLRIQRYGGTNTFLFYIVQSAATPTNWGAPVYSVDVALSDQLEFGLFNSSARNTQYKDADFDNFSYGNPSSCSAAQGQPPVDNAPPGLTSCTDPLKHKGFETMPSNWVLNNGTRYEGGSAYEGNWKLLAPSYEGYYYLPYFYQQFVMPTFVLSTTSEFRLRLFKNINNMGDGDDANDRFYAIVTTGPFLTSTHITDPVQIADGIGMKDAYGAYNPTIWDQVDITLSPASGVNLEDYKGQNLYLYFYNNSNASCAPPNNCHMTGFYFDYVTLSPCTTKPLPSPITTRINGTVIVHQTGVGELRIPGVKVWAYAEGGQLYQTTTIQNGEFNFFNLPATVNGTKYFIYAEYTIVNPANPSELMTYNADSRVILTTANTDTDPVVTQLHLY